MKPCCKQPEYTASRNPYSVVPVFKDSHEHERFLMYFCDKKQEFLDIVGHYIPESTDANKDLIPAAYPEHVDYFCKVGKTLIDWLDKWRKTT